MEMKKNGTVMKTEDTKICNEKMCKRESEKKIILQIIKERNRNCLGHCLNSIVH